MYSGRLFSSRRTSGYVGTIAPFHSILPHPSPGILDIKRRVVQVFSGGGNIVWIMFVYNRAVIKSRYIVQGFCCETFPLSEKCYREDRNQYKGSPVESGSGSPNRSAESKACISEFPSPVVAEPLCYAK